MATHIKILGWLHVFYGVFGLFLAAIVFGGTMLGMLYAGSMTNSVIVGATAGFLGVFFALLAIPHILAGYGLLTRKEWARVLTIILGVIALIRFPLGTALGAYTLWVLLSKDGAAQFQSSSI